MKHRFPESYELSYETFFLASGFIQAGEIIWISQRTMKQFVVKGKEKQEHE